MSNQLINFVEVRERFPRSKSSIYADINTGLFPRGVALGAGSRAYLAAEVDMVAAARAAGFDDDRVRALVRDLAAARQAPDPSAQRAEVYAAHLKPSKR